MFRHLMPALAIAAVLTLPVFAQDSGGQNKNLDIRSSVGDLHVGNDADAKKMGLPLYPGARVKADKNDKNGDKNNDQANLSLFTDAFGMKLIVVNYESDDAPGKIIDFYRDKLKRYGKVLECHTHEHGGNVDVNDNDDDKDGDKGPKHGKELKCDDKDNSGPVTELKVGTEEDQHVISVEPRDAGKGSTFAMVYVHMRGKQGEI